MRSRSTGWSALFLVLSSACTHGLPAASARGPDFGPLPGWSEQIRIREEWLTRRHALQDALMRDEARPGRLSSEVYDGTMARMKARGIEAQIYSHPLGFQGHALGASIDMRAAARKDSPRPLRAGSYLSVELNTRTAIPEWGGQTVFMMEEDPAHLDADGYHFFAERQEHLFLVRGR